MSSTAGVQPRTFSWLTDGFREFLSFQQTLSGDRDNPVSVSDAAQPILESGPTAALLRMKEKKEYWCAYFTGRVGHARSLCPAWSRVLAESSHLA